mgnify:FL=1
MDEYSDGNYYTDQPLPQETVPENALTEEESKKRAAILEEVQQEVGRMLGSVSWTPGLEMPSLEDVNKAPEKILELWRICRRTQWSPTRNRDFYSQAIYASDCEDNVSRIELFFAYNPVYQDMNLAQMRSYFTLRAGWRRGEYPQNISISYVYVYVYELLMQVGTWLPDDGLKKLEQIRDNYGPLDAKLLRNMKEWLKDYVTFYGMIDMAETYFAEEQAEDVAVEVLENLDDSDDVELFEAVAPLSAYHIKDSRLYKRHEELVTTIGGRIIRKAAPILEERYGQSIRRVLVGLRKYLPRPMFYSAVFYRRYPYRKRYYPFTENRYFTCIKGSWTKETFCNALDGERRGEVLGRLMQEMDRQLRARMKGEGKLTKRMNDRTLEAVVEREVERYWAEQQEAERQAKLDAVKVDRSRFDRIRSDADVVREALLTDDDRAEVAPLTVVHTPPPEPIPQPSPEPEPAAVSAFTDQERRFLHLLIEGGDWAGYLRDIRVPMGVMVDGINEKMMEAVQDVVIADRGNGPEVIDDYLDDLVRRI